MKNFYKLVVVIILFNVLMFLLILINDQKIMINKYDYFLELSINELDYKNHLIKSMNQTTSAMKKEILFLKEQLKEENRLKQFYIEETKYHSSLDNKLAMNPRWKDVESFLKKNHIDKNIWDKDTYDCTAFSNELVKSAIENNIFMCIVEINWEEDGHMIVAVNTSDKGLIYIEPQSDNIIDLHIGLAGHSEFQDKTVVSYESCFERVMQ